MNYEEYMARVRKMNPIDDDFLRKMTEDKDFCQEVIRTILDDSPTSELMTIFTENDDYDDEKFPATSGRKRYFKEDEKGVAQMCAIMQEVKEEGREEGRIRAVIEMYLEKDISLKTACKRLVLTEEAFLETVKEYHNQ